MSDTDEQDAATCPECGAHDQHPNHESSGCPCGPACHRRGCPNDPEATL